MWDRGTATPPPSCMCYTLTALVPNAMGTHSVCCSPGVGMGVGVVIDAVVAVGVGAVVTHGSGSRMTAEDRTVHKYDILL